MQGTKIRAGIDPEVVAKEMAQPIERQQRLRVVAARGECSHPQRVPAPMKVIACECGYVVRGATDEELLTRALDHMRDAHPDVLGSVTPDQLLAMAEVVD